VELQARLKEIEAHGATLVAISADPPEDSRELIARLEKKEDTKLGYALLSDPELKTARAYGFHDEKHDIALPATAIVDPGGEIVWKHVGETVADRPVTDELVKTLEELAKGKR